MKNRSTIAYLGIMIRGMAMGAADVIPGVSGGTIAFITGIYEELIDSLSNINLKALKTLKNDGMKSFWTYINGNFFVALFLGIAISVFSLAKLVTFLLENHPVLLWSFFFGLVLASGLLIMKTIRKWNIANVFAIILGTAIAGVISSIEVTASGGDLWYILLSGAIAICAMILPGISGAFILVLLGSYDIVINGIKDVNLTVIGLFAVGCVIGLLSFSRLLKYLFAHFKNFVLALLSGFLFGSLWKIWPWKNETGSEPIIVHSDGKKDWMMTNVLPENYIGDDHLLMAIVMGVLGLVVVMLMGFVGPKELRNKN
jgi:putative membrane protein